VAQVHTSILQFQQAHESRKEKEKERNNGQRTQKPYTKEARKQKETGARPVPGVLQDFRCQRDRHESLIVLIFFKETSTAYS
jgi:hypothetical protein